MIVVLEVSRLTAEFAQICLAGKSKSPGGEQSGEERKKSPKRGGAFEEGGGEGPLKYMKNISIKNKYLNYIHCLPSPKKHPAKF